MSIRVPLNLASYRATMTNQTVLEDYFKKLFVVLEKYGLTDKPDRIWNVDETGVNTELQGQRVVTQMGKRHIYNMSYSDRGQNTTVVASCSAAGHQGPTLVIFRGKRLDPAWEEFMPRNCELSVAPKGWVTNELFLHWLR